MKILYLHGFGSKFDTSNSKITDLETIGTVIGIDIDYTLPHDINISTLIECALLHDVDVIVGTSLGGYFASHVASEIGIPFVACNPAVSPSESLKRYKGENVDFNGNTYVLLDTIIDNYPDFNLESGCGLVLLDEGDELFDSDATIAYMRDKYIIKRYEGGNHRFTHMHDSLSDIKALVSMSEVVYGLN